MQKRGKKQKISLLQKTRLLPNLPAKPFEQKLAQRTIIQAINLMHQGQ